MAAEAAGFFVTGTDTGVGKTVISLGLMQSLQDAGLAVAGMKPVASGCEATDAGLRNEDALALQRQASVPLDYDRVNPYAFGPPIAPHIAAAAAGITIDPDVIVTNYKEIEGSVERVIVEGVGGWLVPIGDGADMADVARRLGLPVILVVGIRLGCLNHALLSQQAILASGLPFAGWVANEAEPPPEARDQIITTLKSMLCAPWLAHVPWSEAIRVDAVAAALSAGPGETARLG
jgi:dethiobiotin synthetase